MADFLETLRLEYEAADAIRNARAMAVALAEENTYLLAQATAVREAGDAIELFGETYEVLPRQIQRTTEAQDGLTVAERKLLESINVANLGLDEQAEAQQAVAAGSAASGRGLLQLGYLADDAKQFFSGPDGLVQGMRAVGNNIPGLVMGLGGSAGLAGGIALVGTAIAVGVPLLKSFVASMSTADVDQFASAVDRLKDRIKELTDNPARLAVDVLELDIAQSKLDALIKSQQAFQALSGQKSRLERESGQEVQALIGEEAGGVAKLTAEVKRLLLQDLTASSDFLKTSEQRLAELEAEIPKRAAAAARGGDPATQAALDRALADARAEQAAIREQRSQMRNLLEKESQTRTADVFTGAFAGDVVQQQKLAALAGRAGRGRLAADIPGASPAAMAAAEDEDRAELAFQQENARAKQARLKREAAHKKATEAAEKEAKDEEAFTDLDQKESDRRLKAREAEAKAAGRHGTAEEHARNRANRAAAADRDEPIVAGLFGGAGGTIEGLLNQNAFARRSGRRGAVTDEQAAEVLTARLAALLQRQGIDRDPLHAQAVAGEVVAKAQADLQKRTGAALGQTQNLQAAMIQVQAQFVQDLAQIDARTYQLFQQLQQGVIRPRQQVHRTAQNRAR